MLDNYAINQYGTIYQVERKPFNYDDAYINTYRNLDCRKMSELRYAYMCNVIGSKPFTICDVGYGDGDFLELCNEKGIYTYGYDVSPQELKHSKRLTWQELLDTPIECMTFFDSLEHFDSIDFVRNLKVKYVVISLPWTREGNDYSDEWFQSWKHRKLDEHIWFFSPTSLSLFMQDMGYWPLNLNNPEDMIRKSVDDKPNILTGVFVKR